MRVLCRHGHFAFYPHRPWDIAQFCSYFELSLEREGDYYTFPDLLDAPDFSLAAKPYLATPAIKTYEGKPWEIFRENGLVYNFNTGLVVPKAAIVETVELKQCDFFYLSSTPLIVPGSRDGTGNQVLSYDGEFNYNFLELKVSEYAYE